MNNITIKQAAVIAGVFAVTLSGLASAASAQQVSEEPLTRAVSYSDLNINATAGLKTLSVRIRGAAQVVCAPLDGRRIDQQAAFHRCVRTGIDSAMTKINERLANVKSDAKEPVG